MSLSLQKQQHHINKLLSTAAAGTGVVGDVDALLTPIGMSTGSTIRIEHKAERNLWREEEMLQMLHLMLKANALEMLNDKSVKSEKVFRNIEKLMFDSGYQKKSYNQIWTKWKFLKSTYMTSRRAGVMPKMIPASIYKVLDTILRTASNVSVCGGNSNGAGGSSLDGYNSDSGRLVISNVESESLTNGFARNKKQSNGIETCESSKETEDDSYGMAHPIFGFRLGIVKPEPIDTGYETPPVNGTISDHGSLYNINANSHSSPPPTSNADFQAEIKQEAGVVEENNSLQKTHKALRETATPASTTPVQQLSPPVVPLLQRNSQMPPLRIAPFAKASQFNIQRQQQPSRSPPPLSMHPVTQQNLHHSQQQQQQQSHRHYTRHSQGHTTGSSTISVNNNKNNNIRIQRLLLPKPVHQQQQHRVISTSSTGTQIRLPREITIHSTPRAPVDVTIPRLKQLAKRHSYEAQHIESVLPDMDSDIILQQQKQQQLAMNFEPSAEGPCTSQQAKLKNRKRRLKLPPMDSRCAKVLKTYSNGKQQRPYQDSDYYNNIRCRLSGRDMDNINQVDTSSRLDTQSIKHNQEKINQQKKEKQFEQQQKKTQKKRDEDYFDEALKDLGKSLRTVQRQVINDFFEKQMEMARKEHEFQARQDKILMEAFEEQTQLIMRSAKTLLGIDLPGLKIQTQSEEQTEAQAKKVSLNDEQKIEHTECKKQQVQEEEEDEESIEPYYQQEEEEEEEDADDDDDGAEDNDENENDADEDDEEDECEEEDVDGEGEREGEEEEQDEQPEDYLDENNDAANDEADEQDENEFEDSDNLEPCADPIELVSSEIVEDTS